MTCVFVLQIGGGNLPLFSSLHQVLRDETGKGKDTVACRCSVFSISQAALVRERSVGMIMRKNGMNNLSGYRYAVDGRTGNAASVPCRIGIPGNGIPVISVIALLHMKLIANTRRVGKIRLFMAFFRAKPQKGNNSPGNGHQ